MDLKEDYRLAAVMFTDIFGFSRMMEADEKKTLDLLQDHNDLITRLVREYNGNIIKTIGDAFLVDFKNTSDAVNCALEIQNRLFRYNSENGTQLMLRIGIHLGDIWFFENDALGEVINVASRLETLARPGRICISHNVYNQIQNKVDVEIISLGIAKLKNISKEITAYEILTDFATLERDAPPPLKQSGHIEENNAHLKTPPAAPTQELDDASLEQLILNRMKTFDSRVPVESIQDDFSVSSERLISTLDRLANRGLLTRVGKSNKLEYGLASIRRFFSRRIKPTIREKIERKIRKARKNISSFAAHIAAYGAVNAFLFAINMMTSSHRLWFLYPLGGWAIGLVTHYAGVVASRRHLKQLKQIPETVTDQQYRLISKLQKTEESLAAHIGSYISVNGFLLMVNLITSTRHFWFIYPLLGWGIGFTIHSATSLSKRKQILLDLDETGYDMALLEDRGVPKIGFRKDRHLPQADQQINQEDGSYQNLLDQSERLKANVIEQVRHSKKLQKQKAGEIEELLNSFEKNIRLLIQRDEEISKTMASASKPDVEKELTDLRNRLEATGSDSLRSEYANSIDQLERYQRSYEELGNQKEKIYLRISGALMSLKQLQLDLQKMEAITFSEDAYSPAGFEDKLEELSDYVNILQESYRDFSVNSR